MALALLLGACDAPPLRSGATIQLDTAEVELEPGASLHEVRVTGSAATDSLSPDTVRATPGDAVRFTTDDHRTHAFVFDRDRLAAPIREYLEATNQLRSPPLVSRGAAWIVLLEDAPAGRYPFLCSAHDARGLLLVGPAH